MQKTVFATNSARHFGVENGKAEIGKFPDGEVSVVLKEDVKDREIFVIGSTEPLAENLIELTFLIHKVFADGAKKVTAVIPYFGYSRGDREAKSGEVASAKVIAKMIQSAAGENFEVVCFDLHSSLIPEFFSCPVKEISVVKELAEKFSGIDNLSIIAPDGGAIKRARRFAENLGINDIVRVEKKRISSEKVEITNVLGSVREKAVIVDDMVQTGGTIIETAKALTLRGAKEISVCVAHMVYSAGGWQKLADSAIISKVITTDTIAPPQRLPDKFEVVSIVPVLQPIFS